jgi:hypothetical protein
MESACALTDAALSAIFRNCRDIEYLSIQGNGKCEGGINGRALDPLRKKKELGKRLRYMRLVNQSSAFWTGLLGHFLIREIG